jgi:hypothetical protein
MAEPYVPIADHTTYAAETNTDALDTAVDNALAHKNTAEALVEGKFNLLFLVGC